MLQSVFAAKMGMNTSHFSEVLHAKRNISAATALKLKKLLGIPDEYWTHTGIQ